MPQLIDKTSIRDRLKIFDMAMHYINYDITTNRKYKNHRYHTEYILNSTSPLSGQVVAMATCAMSSTVALHLTHPAFQNPESPLIIVGIRPELLKYSFSFNLSGWYWTDC